MQLSLCEILHLRSDATPVVGVERARLQHGRHQRQVLRHQQVEHTGIGQQVVAVYELQKDTDGQFEKCRGKCSHVPAGRNTAHLWPFSDTILFFFGGFMGAQCLLAAPAAQMVDTQDNINFVLLCFTFTSGWQRL